MIECSVIIPVYNSGKTIFQTLSSIYASEYQLKIEVIVVDDGSTDNSVELAKQFLKFPYFKLIEKQNGGVSSARNVGIKNAEGKYLFFVDADDIVHREELEKVICFAKERDADLIVANYETHFINTGETLLIKNEFRSEGTREQKANDILERLFKGENSGLSNVWNKLYLKSFLQKHDLWFDEKRTHGEDWAFNIRVFEKKPRFFTVGYVLYTYRLDGTQNYNKYRKNLGYSLSNGYDIICDINDRYLHFSKHSDELYMATTVFFEQICNYLNLEAVSKREKRKFLKEKSVKRAAKTVLSIKTKDLGKFHLSRKDKLKALKFFFGVL